MSKRNTNRNKFNQNNQQVGKKTKDRKQDTSSTKNASTHIVEEPTLVLSQYSDNVMSVIPNIDVFKLQNDGFITITLKKKNTSGIKDIKRALYFGAYQREKEYSIMHDIQQSMLAFINKISDLNNLNDAKKKNNVSKTNKTNDEDLKDFASTISIMQLRVITDMFKAKMLSLVQSVEYDSEKTISIVGLEAHVKSNLCVIVGDINGNIIDFVKTVNSALARIKENSNTVYVFLGNYTGIGKDNIDVLLLMMILMITYNNFVFLRGPNENIATLLNMYNKMSEGSISKMDDMDDINNLTGIDEMNEMSMFSSQSNFIKDINDHGAFVHGYDSNNDFFMDDNNKFLLNNSEDETNSFNFKYSFFKNIVSVFRYLPIACIVNDTYYCIHGGVPSDIARYIYLMNENLPLNIIKDEDANKSTLVLYDALSNRPYATSEDYNTKKLDSLSHYYGKSDVDQFIVDLNKNNRSIKTLVVSDLSGKDTMRRDNMVVVYSSNILSIIDSTITNKGTYYLTTLDKIIPFEYKDIAMFNTIVGVDLDPVFKLVIAMIHGNDTDIDMTKNEITALCKDMTITDSTMFNLADFIKSIFSVYDMYSGEEKLLSEDANVDLYQLDDVILQLASSISF